jgi:hypothetical protein
MFADVGLAAAVRGTTRDGFGETFADDVKTVGGEATGGPSSALSQSDAASAGTLTGVTGRRL